MFILLGYLVVALAILGGAIGISPRIQQLMSRWRARKPMPMTDWSNDVEETSVNMVRLLMETAEVDVHWAWLMQNAPPEYQDKLILAWDRLHQTEPRSYGARMAAAVASGWAAGEHVPAEPASGSTTIRSPPSVVPEPTGVAPAGPTAPRKRHSFMVFEGGRVLPAKTGND